MNRFIANAGINSFCVNGICYYTITCKNYNNCRILYCTYHLLSNEEACSMNNFEDFNLYIHNKIPFNKTPQNANNMPTNSDNREDNNIA